MRRQRAARQCRASQPYKPRNPEIVCSSRPMNRFNTRRRGRPRSSICSASHRAARYSATLRWLGMTRSSPSGDWRNNFRRAANRAIARSEGEKSSINGNCSVELSLSRARPALSASSKAAQSWPAASKIFSAGIACARSWSRCGWNLHPPVFCRQAGMFLGAYSAILLLVSIPLGGEVSADYLRSPSIPRSSAFSTKLSGSAMPWL